MNKISLYPALFLLLLCCGCRKAEKQTEIMRHHERLLHALVANDTALLRQEQLYVVDTLQADSLLASPQVRDYLHAWVNSYRFRKDTVETSASFEDLAGTCTERISAGVKRLAVRLLDAGKEKQLEEMLRIVAGRLLELGMNDAAAVTAAASVGIDADPTWPGDIARRLLTRLLLVGKQIPTLSHTAPLLPGAPTLLLFYESGCSGCEATLHDFCENYTSLEERGIRVVSIASDEDEEVFLARANSLPWAAKWRVANGFYSPDFEAYGIASLPTLVVILPNGRIAGFYHRLEDTGLLTPPATTSPATY